MAEQKQPNILVLWGDDIGITNLSCYSDGLMGYRTPNIDRVAQEGMRFTDAYGEQSCTAGRSAFITGQSVFRTGLSKVGLPGAELGMSQDDPTIAGLLKSRGYATGQFGKNHLGDRDEHLPTMHGFDEFFGNLYHLNAEEEPEQRDYPSAGDFPNFRKNYGPRGVLHCWANGDGTQRIEDTGPLTRKRMETADEEFLAAAKDFIARQHDADTPFFVWFNTTHMHFRTHAKPESLGQAGRWQSEYHDVMIDHDRHIGEMLDLLDELGIADDTIVFYSTDNGPHMNTWPDGGMTPFRNEKNSNWEGAYRIPAMVRWPGKIPAGVVSNEIISHLDWLPTFLAAAGDPDVKEELKQGHEANGRTYRIHLDGYDLLPYLTGAEEKSPRPGYYYFSEWNSAPPARSRSGPSLLSPCACRSSLICAPTPLSGPTSPRIRTLTGSWITSICLCRRRASWRSSWQPFRIILRDRKRPALASIRSWRSFPSRCKGRDREKTQMIQI